MGRQQQETHNALRIRRQLVEAMLFEGIFPCTEKLLPDGRTLFIIHATEEEYHCIGKRTAFGRIRLAEKLMTMISDGHLEAEVTIEALLSSLAKAGNIAQLSEELTRTRLLADYNEAHLPKQMSRRDLSYEALELALEEGHLYHPSYKARVGFTIEDHVSYGPEFQKSFPLHWVAIRKKDMRLVLPKEEQSFWQEEMGREVWRSLVLSLCRQGGQLDEYTFLPVHPWQWKKLKCTQLGEALLAKDVIDLGCLGDTYQATQSVRTLMNATNSKKAHVKLALQMRQTSSVRTLPAHTVCAAPPISAWLQEVIQGDPFLRTGNRLAILTEYASVCYAPQNAPWQEEIAGQLACIWRESVSTHVKAGENAIPFTALALTEGDGDLFIAPWLVKYGVNEWVKQFLEVAVLPVWHLLVNHGIAVEAHAQNMILIVKDGWPVRLLLRDFHESLEYHHEYVADPTLVPDFSTIHEVFANGIVDHFYWMSSVEALRMLVMDTLFVFHLTELSHALAAHHYLNESSFWKQVRTILADYAREPFVKESRLNQLGADAALIGAESLLKNKLLEKECHHLVCNTLCEELGKDVLC
ncbi:IucA/IucC family protein [Bacillus sp. FSL W7-1360]